jgi:hypothetical protein
VPDRPVKHLDPATLQALATGDLKGTELGADFLLHLIALCPVCSEAMVRWTTEGAEPPARKRAAPPPPPPEEPSLTKRQLRALLARAEEERLEVIEVASPGV